LQAVSIFQSHPPFLSWANKIIGSDAIAKSGLGI
jgi:hypothetical protein